MSDVTLFFAPDNDSPPTQPYVYVPDLHSSTDTDNTQSITLSCTSARYLFPVPPSLRLARNLRQFRRLTTPPPSATRSPRTSRHPQATRTGPLSGYVPVPLSNTTSNTHLDAAAANLPAPFPVAASHLVRQQRLRRQRVLVRDRPEQRVERRGLLVRLERLVRPRAHRQAPQR